MRRSPTGLVIVLVLIGFALVGAGVISWTPTHWETHAAHTIAKDAGKAAKTIGVKVNVPPQPPGITPAPKSNTSTATPTAPNTQGASQTQTVTTLYPTPSGQAIPAPTAQPAITESYCALEGIASGVDGCP